MQPPTHNPTSQPWPDQLEYDPLIGFYNWYINAGPSVPLPPIQAVSNAGAFTGLTLYRRGQFQVQLWVGQPNAIIPEHVHTDHDTILMGLSGVEWFDVNGARQDWDPTLVDTKGRWRHHGVIVRVEKHDTHSAKFGPDGGSFITFQHWPCGGIRSAEMDWQGEPLSVEHGMALSLYGCSQPKCKVP